MDSLWPIVSAFAQVNGPPALTAACASLGVWIAFGWLLGPVFRLPGLRRIEPAYFAARPLLSFAICWLLFYRLHADGVLELGVGPTSWARAGLWALIGAAGAQGLHHLIQSRAPALSNAAARALTDGVVAAVAEKIRRAPPSDPPAPEGGTP